MLYTYRVDKPEAAGTFVIAPLQLSPQRAQGATYSIYTPPAAANTAPAYADAVSHVLDFYNDDFGALPEPGLTVAQLPDGTVDGFAAPGLLLVSARQWSAKPNERLLADLAAHQWWGAQVTAGYHLRRLDHGRPFALLRGIVCRANCGQGWAEQGARGLCGGRADVRRFRAHRRRPAAGARDPRNINRWS